MGDTWELINHPMSDETGLELAAQMKRQNDILAGIAAGTAGAEFVDATFRGLLQRALAAKPTPFASTVMM